MADYGPEPFSGTNGDPLPSPWVDVSSTGGTTTQQDGWARVRATIGGAGNHASARLADNWPEGLITCKFRTPASLTVEAYPSVWVRAADDLRTTGYWFSFNWPGSVVTIGEEGVGSLAQTAFTYATSTTYNAAVRFQGTALKFWVGAGAWDGSSWLLETTDATLTTGKVGIQVYPGAVSTDMDAFFDDFAVNDLSPSQGSYPMSRSHRHLLTR